MRGASAMLRGFVAGAIVMMCVSGFEIYRLQYKHKVCCSDGVHKVNLMSARMAARVSDN